MLPHFTAPSRQPQMPAIAAPAGPPIVLGFAASDPTAGAGAQADLLTIAALGAHPVSVVTGITAQDTRGVESWWPLEADCIDEQARILLQDMHVAAFKIGVVGNPEIAAVIAEIISDYPGIPVVLDPLHAVSTNDALDDDDLVDALRELLMPLATLLTPNSVEARRLAEEGDDDDGQLGLPECARRLLDCGAGNVLITGVHERTPQVVNTLYGLEGVLRADAWERLPGSYHGAGDTLAAAVATRLAFGQPLSQAVREAQDYTWHTLRHGFVTGMGQWIPDRFFGLRG